MSGYLSRMVTRTQAGRRESSLLPIVRSASPIASATRSLCEDLAMPWLAVPQAKTPAGRHPTAERSDDRHGCSCQWPELLGRAWFGNGR